MPPAAKLGGDLAGLMALALRLAVLVASASAIAVTPSTGATTAITLLTHRVISSSWAPGSAWTDVTALVEEALPPLPAALCHMCATDDALVALIDPNLLDTLGDAGDLAVTAPGRTALSLAVHEGRPLLPDGARVVLLRPEAADDAPAADVTIELTIETSEALAATSQPPAQQALARATLRAALTVIGVSPEEADALDAAESSAGKVFGTFVGSGGATGRGGVVPRGELLEAAARRSAHHIAHLLRAERAAAAEYLRNTDPTEARPDARPAHRIHLVLDNVRSAYNVGSLFRTADTAHVAEVVTCGFTPHNRAGHPPHPKLAKTGFSALESVPTRHFDTTLAAVAALRAEGVSIVCMETTEHAHNYVEHTYPRQDLDGGGGVALVLGNEEIGVDTRVLGAADATVEIPTFGAKNSLNIAAAAPVVVFEVLRQWGMLGGGGGGAQAASATGASASSAAAE